MVFSVLVGDRGDGDDEPIGGMKAMDDDNDGEQQRRRNRMPVAGTI